jgi:hypothetical protein
VRPERIADNIDILDFTLSADDVATVDALDTGVRGGPGVRCHKLPAALCQNCVRYPRHVRNGTAPIAGAIQTEVVSSETKLGSLSNVKPGDILVSHSTAVREHDISVSPNAPHAVSPTHDAAVRAGRSEAHALGVDAWLTEDHIHVVKIASHRAPGK